MSPPRILPIRWAPSVEALVQANQAKLMELSRLAQRLGESYPVEDLKQDAAELRAQADALADLLTIMAAGELGPAGPRMARN